MYILSVSVQQSVAASVVLKPSTSGIVIVGVKVSVFVTVGVGVTGHGKICVHSSHPPSK